MMELEDAYGRLAAAQQLAYLPDDDDDDVVPAQFDDDDLDPMGAPPDAPAPAAVVEYPIGFEYTWSNWSNATEFSHASLGLFQLAPDLAAALSPDGNLSPGERIDLFMAQGFVTEDDFSVDGLSGYTVTDIYIQEGGIVGRPAAYGDAHGTNDPGQAAIVVPATQQQGQGSTSMGVVAPTVLSNHHAALGFRDPLTRLSYDSQPMRVDHAGLSYDSENVENLLPAHEDFQDPWLRDHLVLDCCWFNAIINLVNVTMQRTVLTYDKLWRIMGKKGAFDPAEARLGFSIGDMVTIFDHFDRTVTVLDGDNKLVYSRHRSCQRRRNNIRPEVWNFLMTEHHVSCLTQTDLMRADIDTVRCLYYDKDAVSYVHAVVNHPYELVSPMFPAYEIQKPLFLKNLDGDLTIGKRGNRARTAPYIVQLLAPGAEGLEARESQRHDHTTLHEALFHPRFSRCHLAIVTSPSMLKAVLLRLVTHYRYKPQITCDDNGSVTSISIVSLSDRASIRFRHLLPPQSAGVIPDFQDLTQLEAYVRARHHMVSHLMDRSVLSYMHESVAQVCHRYARGGLYHTFHNALHPDPATTYNSCDVNRLYPSILLDDHVPVVDLFDRFELLPDNSVYDHQLQPHDLCLVYFSDTGSIYSDRPVSLCFKTNLDAFLARPNVVLLDPQSSVPMHDHATGITYVQVKAFVRTRMHHTAVQAAIGHVWHTLDLPRTLRKFAMNSCIGRLGTRTNQKASTNRSSLFCNREEAAVHAEKHNHKLVSIDDMLFYSIERGISVPRLQGGYIMHLWVLDHARSNMQRIYDELVEAGVPIAAVACDEFYYPAKFQSIVDNFVYQGDPDSLEAFGTLKTKSIGCTQEYLPRRMSHGLMSFMHYCSGDMACLDENALPFMDNPQDQVVHVEAVPDEYHVENLREFHRLLIRADVPGAGKSHTVLSQCAKNCVVVCPTNALCVEFQTKYKGCRAMTLHKFLGLTLNESGDLQDRNKHGGKISDHQVERNKVLLLDEIYMYPQTLLNKLYVRLLTTSATHVYATGDPNQLPPVDDSQKEKALMKSGGVMEDILGFDPFEDDFEDGVLPFSVVGCAENRVLSMHDRRCRSIDHLFPRQLILKKCKRASTESDNKRMEMLCRRLRNVESIQSPVEIVREQFVNVSFEDAIAMMKQDPANHLAVCYYNRTCHTIADRVLDGKKLTPGVRLVNRAHLKARGNVVLRVNYEYIVQAVDAHHVVLKDDQNQVYTVPKHHAQERMQYYRTRTCHSLQGTSVSGAIILFDLFSPHVTREFIYVALTRARSLNTVCYVL